MTPKFEVYEDQKGGFRWRLVAGNGQIVAVASEGYSQKSDAMHGLDLLREIDMGGDTEVFEDRTGEFRWHLTAANGNIIATGGQGYSRRDACVEALGLVYGLAPGAPVRDMTVPWEDAAPA